MFQLRNDLFCRKVRGCSPVCGVRVRVLLYNTVNSNVKKWHVIKVRKMYKSIFIRISNKNEAYFHNLRALHQAAKMIVIKYRNKNFSPLQKKYIFEHASSSLFSPIPGYRKLHKQLYKTHRIYSTINTKSTKYQWFNDCMRYMYNMYTFLRCLDKISSIP